MINPDNQTATEPLRENEAMKHDKVKTECPLEVMAAIGPFEGELVEGDFAAAIERIESFSPLDAVRLVLAAYCRSDSVVGDQEIDDLAEALGCFEKGWQEESDDAE